MKKKVLNPLIENVYPLTPMQEGMLYHSVLGESNSDYVVQNIFHLNGKVKEEWLGQAMDALSMRFAVLRTSFMYENVKKPMQVVMKKRKLTREFFDLSSYEETEQATKVEEICKQDLQRGFHVSKDSLLRFTYIKLGVKEGQEQAVLIWCYHHLILDGWCIGKVFGFLKEAYDRLSKGETLEELEKDICIQVAKEPKYSDYVTWISKQDKKEGLKYWERLIGTYEERAVIRPLTDKVQVQETVSREKICFSLETTEKLNVLAAKNHTTLNIVMEALWGVVLQKCTGLDDVVYGKVVSGRNVDIEGIDQVAGLFINTVPVRVKTERQTTTFSDIVKSLQQQTVDANTYFYCSLSDIQGVSSQKQNLIQSLFVFENYEFSETELADQHNGFSMIPVKVNEKTNYPMNAIVELEEGTLNLQIMYDAKIYRPEEVKRILERALVIAESICREHEVEIGKLPAITEEEVKCISLFNKTKEKFPDQLKPIQLFEQNVKKNPQKTALVFGERQVTYDSLDKMASRVCDALQKEGVSKGDFVALMCHQGIEAFAGLLGVLKAGAVYVPVDPDYPVQRIQFILGDCSPKGILTYQTSVQAEVPVLDLEDICNCDVYNEQMQSVEVKLEDLMYCIYTSGTTGKPKGVLIEQTGVLNLIYYFQTKQNVTKADRVLQFANIAFDAVVSELSMSLFTGATLYLVQESVKEDKVLFEAYLRKHEITIGILPPQFLAQIKVEGLRTIITAGAETNQRLVEENKHIPVYSNDYGPTEVTVCATYWRHESSNKVPKKVPIGVPIPNKQVYIMKENSLCGIGVPGELCIAGTGLARGYLNRPELTKEKFIENPFGEGRLYRSGDLARWLEDGTIEYLGRVDNQVKIRGFRIELEEVELALKEVPHISDAVALPIQDAGYQVLCAYLVSDTDHTLNVRSVLQHKLPAYMIPSHFVFLKEIPLTRNGKPDKTKLEAIKNEPERAHYNPAVTQEQKDLCEVFEGVLGVENPNIDWDFFQCGGDSIKAIQIVSRLKMKEYAISVKEIMSGATIEQLAHTIRKKVNVNESRKLVCGAVRTTPMIRLFQSWDLKKPEHFNQSIILETRALKENQIKAILNELMSYHDCLRGTYQNGVLTIQPYKENRNYQFQSLDYRNRVLTKEEQEKIVQTMQESILLEKGPLVQAAWIQRKEGNVLLLVIHHLVVDIVSWNILKEDFEMLSKQMVKGEEMRLPVKGTSFQEWAQLLEEYSKSDAIEKDKNYWKNVKAQIPSAMLSFDSTKKEAVYQDLKVQWSEDGFGKKLEEAAVHFKSDIRAFILSACVESIKELTDRNKLSVMLEGHGREQIHKETSIEYTVGWFTSVYPIVLQCEDTLLHTMISVKELLKNVPSKGISYGIIEQDFSVVPDFQFNYLGKRLQECTIFENRYNSAEQNHTTKGMIMNCWLQNESLVIQVEYNENVISRDWMDKLLSQIKRVLEAERKICLEENVDLTSPSDYKGSRITYSELQNIKEQVGNLDRVEQIYPLTYLQQGMAFHWLANKHSSEYIIQHRFNRIEGLNVDNVKAAGKLLAKKHEVLRTSIVYKGLSEPRQIIVKDRCIEIRVENVEEYDNPEGAVLNCMEQDVQRGFDLTTDPLFRIHLIRVENQQFEMIWTFHHIIVDGWCIAILLGDFTEFYNRLKAGEEYEAIQRELDVENRLTPSYGEYVELLQDRNEEMEYWEELLNGYDEIITIKPIESQQGKSEAKREKYKLCLEETKTIMEAAKQQHVTVNTMVETALGVLLARYNNVEDVVYGKIVSGRDVELREIDRMVGLFINTIPVRVQCEKNKTSWELLSEQQKQGTKSITFSSCSLSKIQSATRQKQDLIHVLFAYENYFIDEKKQKGGKDKTTFSIQTTREQTNYEITVCAYVEEDQLNLGVLYDGGMYSQWEMKKLLERLRLVLLELEKETKIVDINVITKEEELLVHEVFNRTEATYPEGQTISEIFSEQVKLYPDQIALEYEDRKLTYRQLNQKANCLAHKLRALGVGRDSIVALLTERSCEMLIAIVAVWKAGGAYIPIDPEYPEDRIQYILNDCNPKAVFIYGAKLESNIPIIDLKLADSFIGEDSELEQVNETNDIAYIIYTSGTTGRPKGVAIEHHGVMAMLGYLRNLYKVDEKDVVLQYANYVFDASVWEIVISILNGAKLVLIAKNTIADIRKFNEYTKKKEISITLLPPQYYLQSNINNLKVLTTGGSAANLDVVKKAKDCKRYINAYGPTENTVLATHWEPDKTDAVLENIPIGKPISNTKIYIMNGNTLCGIGMPGELCIAGAGLARGYVNQPELTAEKFVNNPFGQGRLYHSGDLAKWTLDGTIEYMGRVDEQVKIRGFRVELNEIEQVIRDNLQESDCVVKKLDLEQGNTVLCAYITCPEKFSNEALKEKLHTILPDYMVPAFLIQIPEFPLTKSGKIDKRALQVPDISSIRNNQNVIEARTDFEEEVLKVWQEILGFEEISMTDNFFELGGNSLLIIKMLSKLDAVYPDYLQVGEIFANPTIEKLAEAISKKTSKVVFIEPVPFPNEYFTERLHQGNQTEEQKIEGELAKAMNALYEENPSMFHSIIQFAYGYLIQMITEEKKFYLYEGSGEEFCKFPFNIETDEDFNEVIKQMEKQFEDAEKYKEIQYQIQIKENAIVPVLLYQYTGNINYQEFADIIIDIERGTSSIKIELTTFNTRISNDKRQEMLLQYIQLLKSIF